MGCLRGIHGNNREVSPAHVILQMSCPLAPVGAVGTSIWLFSSVDTHMAAEIACAQEGDSPTVGAQMWSNLSLTVHFTALQKRTRCWCYWLMWGKHVQYCFTATRAHLQFTLPHVTRETITFAVTYCLE